MMTYFAHHHWVYCQNNRSNELWRSWVWVNKTILQNFKKIVHKAICFHKVSGNIVSYVQLFADKWQLFMYFQVYYHYIYLWCISTRKLIWIIQITFSKSFPRTFFNGAQSYLHWSAFMTIFQQHQWTHSEKNERCMLLLPCIRIQEQWLFEQQSLRDTEEKVEDLLKLYK